MSETSQRSQADGPAAATHAFLPSGDANSNPVKVSCEITLVFGNFRRTSRL